MACCNAVRPDRKASLQQGLPFHIAVAGDTWIGGAPRQILLGKIIHYPALKFLFKIHNIIRDTQFHGDSAGVIYCAQTAAASLCLLDLGILILPYLHGYSDHIITLLL